MAWQVRRGVNSPLSSGAGRLFDAVSALVGVCDTADYEGQAAVELEIAAGDEATAAPYPFAADDGSLDLRPAIRAMLRDRELAVPVATIAARFHATLAEAILQACRVVARDTGLERVCLSGGTFQNVRLLEQVVSGWKRPSVAVLAPSGATQRWRSLAGVQAVVAGAMLVA